MNPITRLSNSTCKGNWKTAMVSCSRFIWITNSSHHRRVWTANLLHTKSLPNPCCLQEIRNLNPPMVAGICDPNKSRTRHHRSLKLGSKLKYRKTVKRKPAIPIILKKAIPFLLVEAILYCGRQERPYAGVLQNRCY